MTRRAPGDVGVCAPADAGHESSFSSPPRNAGAPFVWSGRDIADSSAIALGLDLRRQHAHSEAVIEANVELQCRGPRIADAHRFFNASRRLAECGDTATAAMARELGARIAMAATGFTVVNVQRLDAGATTAYLVTPHKGERLSARQRRLTRRAADSDVPLVLAFRSDDSQADGFNCPAHGLGPCPAEVAR